MNPRYNEFEAGFSDICMGNNEFLSIKNSELTAA